MRMNLLAASAAVACLLAAPAMAHPPAGDEKVQRVIVMTGDDARKGGVRTFRVHRGEGGVAFADCDGDKTAIEEGAGKEKTRIFFCGKLGLSGEERAKRLEEVRERLARNDHFSSEHRAKVEAALQEAINRARGGK